MDNGNHTNFAHTHSRRNVLVGVAAILFALGGIYLFLTARFDKNHNESIGDVTPAAEICCLSEAIAQAAESAQATAEASVIEIEQELATAVEQNAILTNEREALQRELIRLQARELAVYSQKENGVFPQRSLLLAIEALKVTSEAGMLAEPAAEDAFFSALSKIGGIGLHGHTAGITAVAVSPDGRWLATASDDTTVRLWNLASEAPGSFPIILAGHQHSSNDLAISSDSHWLASTGVEGIIKLWDLTTINASATPIELRGHEYNVLKVVFSPDNRWLISGSSDHTVRLWNLAALNLNEATIVLPGHNTRVEDVVVSPDGHWLFTSSSNTLIRWDLTADDIIGSLTLLPFSDSPLSSYRLISPRPIAISPDGRWLAVGIYDGLQAEVRVWDLSSSDVTSSTHTFTTGMSGSILALTFSPDSRFLATSHLGDMVIYIWDLTADDPADAPIVLSEHHAHTEGLAFSPDSQWLVSASQDNLVRLWSLTSSYYSSPVVLYGHEAGVGNVTFSPDGRWLVTTANSWEPGADYSVRLWDWGEMPHFSVMPQFLGSRRNWVNDIAISSDDRWLFILDQRLCDGEGCEPPGDAAAALWPLQSIDQASESIELFQHEGYISDTALSPDGHWLAVGGESREVWLWDLSAADPAKTKMILTGHTGRIDFVEFTPDNRWLVTAGGYSISTPYENDKIIRLWNVNGGDSVTMEPIELSGHEEMLWGIRVSQNGRWLLSWDQGSVVYIWDLWADDPASTSRRLNLPPQSIGKDLTAVAISPDGKWLATGGDWPDNMVRLYDLTVANPVADPLILTTYHSDPLEALIENTLLFFSEDGRWLITGRSREGNPTQMWNVTAAEPTVAPLTLQCGNDHFIALSQDQRWIVTNGDRLTSCLWDISNPDQGVKAITLYDQPEFTYRFAEEFMYAHFTQDGQTLVTTVNNVVHFWDLTELDINKSAKTIYQEGDFAWLWTVNSNGRWFARVDERTQIYLWDRQVDQSMVDWACQTVGRSLTLQEWYIYFDDEPYQPTCPEYPPF